MMRVKRWISSPAENLLLLSIVACVLEGAFRKWVFRESTGTVRYVCYFAKDIIFATIPFCRPRAALNRHFKRILLISVPLILTGAVLAAIHEVNLVGALLSLRALVILPLLAYFAIPRLASVNIDRVAFLIGGLTVLNALLGIVQNSSAPDAPINYYATSDFASATAFEENVRAAGTFSYITGYSNLAMIGAWAGMSLLCLARGRISYVFAGWGFYLASLICALVSISRGTVVIVLAIPLGLALSGGAAVVNIVKGLVAAVALFFVGYILSVNPVLERLTDTVIARNESADDTFEGRTVGPFFEAAIATETFPLGAGFGTEQVGGVYAETGVMSMRRFESQFARLVVETGLIGFLGFLIMCAGTLYLLFEQRHSVSDEGARRVAVLSVLLVASFFFTNEVFNHFASFFAWVVVAITLATTARMPGQSILGVRSVRPATPALPDHAR
jgi:hypothetical protein